jgi:hypothetical protein
VKGEGVGVEWRWRAGSEDLVDAFGVRFAGGVMLGVRARVSRRVVALRWVEPAGRRRRRRRAGQLGRKGGAH